MATTTLPSSLLLILCALLGIFSLHSSTAFRLPASDPIYPDKNYTTVTIQDSLYGVRAVSYWVTDNDLAIIDGDVVYGTLQELLDHVVDGQTPRSLSIFHNGEDPSAPWPSATLVYNFPSTAVENTLTSIVNSAIANWKATSPYLTFKKVANSATSQNGVVTINAAPCGGCFSKIGYGNEPRGMNLQQSCPGTGGTCGVPQATHELGHALGLYHEHQRPDREKYVHYNCANLNPGCTNMPPGTTCCSGGIPSGCCNTASNFVIISGFADDAAGAYDISSIMHYTAGAFALPGTNTLTSAAKGVVVPVSAPSAIATTDSDRVCKIYAPQCPKAQTCAGARCPSSCTPVKRCTKPSICDNINPKPPCCFPVTVQQCESEKAACTAKGCDFLLS